MTADDVDPRVVEIIRQLEAGAPEAGDVLERIAPFVETCEHCDNGLPVTCTCPDWDHRVVLAEAELEIKRLRARTELADSEMLRFRAVELAATQVDTLRETGATRMQWEGALDQLAFALTVVPDGQ